MSARLTMLEKLIEKGSVDPFVHYAHAMELRSLGRGDDALAAFATLCERFSTYVPSYLMAGQLAIELGKRDLARTFLETGLTAARAAGDDHAESEISNALSTLL